MRSLPSLCDCPYVNGFSFLLHMRLVTAVPGKFLGWKASKGLVCLILLRCTVCFVIFMLKEPSPAFAYLDAGGLCADFEIRPRGGSQRRHEDKAAQEAWKLGLAEDRCSAGKASFSWLWWAFFRGCVEVVPGCLGVCCATGRESRGRLA